MKTNKIKKKIWEKREAFKAASRNFNQFFYWLKFEGDTCAALNQERAEQARIFFQNDANYSFYSEIAQLRFHRETNQDFVDSLETVRDRLESERASDFFEALSDSTLDF